MKRIDFKPTDYHDIELDELFENPSTYKIAFYFLKIGGYSPVIAFILFVFIVSHLTKVREEINGARDECAKISNDKKPEWKDLRIGENFIDVIKIIFNYKKAIQKSSKNGITVDTPEMHKLEMNVKLQIINLFFAISSIVMYLVLKIILSLSAELFRERFFEEFLDKVKISHFSNPNECLGFINGVIGNIENFFSSCFFALGVLMIFLVKYIQSFSLKKEHISWNIILVLWLIIQLLIGLAIHYMYTAKKDSTIKIQSMEDCYLRNAELQRIFMMFSNSKKQYLYLLRKLRKQKIQKDLLFLLLSSLSLVVTLFAIGFSFFWFFWIDPDFVQLSISIVALITAQNQIPQAFSNFVWVQTSMKNNLSVFKCDKNNKTYITLMKKDLEKEMNDLKYKGEPLQYLKEKYKTGQITNIKNKFVVQKINLESIKTIEFQNATFQYQNSNLPRATRNMNFSIKKNSNEGLIIILFGGSGSGKSTFAYLILKLYEISKGKILINGTDLEQINQKDMYSKSLVMLQFTKFIRTSLNNNIGSVINSSQKDQIQELTHQSGFLDDSTAFFQFLLRDFSYVKTLKNINLPYKIYKISKEILKILFKAKLEKNIRSKKHGYYDYLLNRAIFDSGLWDFVELMPQKGDTIIQDGGTNLSGGMRQMVALAMVNLQIYFAELLNTKKVIALFDEPVASLDSKNASRTAKRVIEAVKKFKSLGFVIDHSGLFLKEALKKHTNLRFQIMFFSNNGIKIGTIDELMQDQDFAYLYDKYKNNKLSEDGNLSET